VLYSFEAGDYATEGVTAFNGSLYGTFGIESGGGGVYELNSSGAERVLETNVLPLGGLTVANGLIYGAGFNYPTFYGLFSITPSGKMNLVSDFNNFLGGPVGELVYVNGTFYGALGNESSGDLQEYGGAYEVTPSGTALPLYSFTGSPDGEYPMAGLLYLNGELYGTTSCYNAYYGNYDCSGTVFSLTTTGTETTLYRFKGGSDGLYPFASLVYLHGLLYGTTIEGGIANNGVVFAISPSGAEHVVYRFKNVPDGADPRGHLTVVGDELYGTTAGGGANGLGTIFSVTTDGVERVVHSFSAADGTQPASYLTYHGGILYGTTTAGGKNGAGTVFRREP